MNLTREGTDDVHLLGRVDRAQQVLRILQGYGFGPLTEPSWSGEDAPERLRDALVELGTPAVKLGQFLAQRPDLIGVRFSEALESLHADVPAEPADVAMAALEEGLGCAREEVYARVDPEPVAAGSIGQVHAAELRDGREVVVEIRRPDIAERCRVDLAVLEDLAKMAEVARVRPELDLAGIIDRFRAALERELDFRLEAASLERFQTLFAEDDRVDIPSPVGRASTETVLTMTRVEGVPFSDLDALREQTEGAEALADVGVALFLDMIHAGIYHADPHPGNLFLTAPGRVGLVDFGMVGWLTPSRRAAILGGVRAFRDDEPEGLATTLMSMTEGSRPDRDALVRDLRTLLQRHRRLDMGEVAIDELLNDLVNLLREHRRRLKGDVALLFRCVVVLDGTARALCPGYQLVGAIERWSDERVRQDWMLPDPVVDAMPRWLMGRLPGWLASAPASLGPLQELPEDVVHLLDQLHLTLRVKPVGLDGAVHRLTVATVIAALLLGGSLLLAARVPPVFWDVSLSGTLGVLLGLGLAPLTLTPMLWRPSMQKGAGPSS